MKTKCAKCDKITDVQGELEYKYGYRLYLCMFCLSEVLEFIAGDNK